MTGTLKPGNIFVRDELVINDENYYLILNITKDGKKRIEADVLWLSIFKKETIKMDTLHSFSIWLHAVKKVSTPSLRRQFIAGLFLA